MKKALLIFTIFTMCVVNAQVGDVKKLVQKDWKIDLESMKAVIEKMIEENPSTASLDEQNKQVAKETALGKISDMKINYKSDGTMFITRNKESSSKGKWEISSDDSEITHITDDNGSTKKYKIVTLSDSNLQLLTDKNITLFFIPNN